MNKEENMEIRTLETFVKGVKEETDSELAKYTIKSLSSLIKNQEEQLKANDLMINELINRINKAIEKYEKCKEEDYCTLALDMYDILRGEDNE